MGGNRYGVRTCFGFRVPRTLDYRTIKLKTLALPTLEGRRLTADLTFCYQIINGLVLDPAHFFVFHDWKTRSLK